MKPEVNLEQVSTELLLPFMKEMLSEGKTVRLTVTGNSMLPLLRNRTDSVFLVAPKKIKKYDIVFFERDNGEAILHRIVGKRKDGYVIVGDNQLVLEACIRPEQILGVVTAFTRSGRTFSVNKWWCRLYGAVWGFLRPVRRPLLPLIFRLIQGVKRIEKMNGETK